MKWLALKSRFVQKGFMLLLLSLIGAACKPTLTVVLSDAGKSQPSVVTSVTPLVAKAGDSISVTGTSIRKNLALTIDGITVLVSPLSSTEGVFVFPSVKVGLKNVRFTTGSASSGEFEMIADTAGDGLPVIPLTPDQVCSNINYRDGGGIPLKGTRSCADTDLAYCAYDGQTSCITSDALPAISVAQLMPELPKIHETISVAGIYGTMKNCDETHAVGCYVNPNLGAKALPATSVDTTKVLHSYTSLGVEGAIGNCSIAGTSSCYTGAAFYAGTTCAANGSDCFLPAYSSGTQDLKAVNIDGFTADVIKKGEVIAGITGDFPSATYPLTVGDAFTDLTSAGFQSAMAASATVGWFDRTGTRMSHAGDAGLVTTSIKNGVSIFGVTGNQIIPDTWDVRAGASIGIALTGKIPTLCQNRSKLSIWNVDKPPALNSGSLQSDATDNTITIPNHGFTTGDAIRIDYFGGLTGPTPLTSDTVYYAIVVDSDTFRVASSLANALTATAIDLTNAGARVVAYKSGTASAAYFNSIDDFANGTAMSTMTTFGSSSQICEGREVTAGDGNAWKEIAGSDCASSPSTCVMQDKISSLLWSPFGDSGSWAYALAQCSQLSWAGRSNWRLPSQKELVDAYLHGMRSAATTNWLTEAQIDQNFWAATTDSRDTTRALYVSMNSGEAGPVTKSSNISFVCVHDP